MGMNPRAMCGAIQDEFENITNNTDWKNGERPHQSAYIEAFDKGLTEYVENNIEIEYGWSAVLPPPASSSDPITSFTSKLVITNKRIGHPPNVTAWGTMIRICFASGIIQHPPAFAVPSGTLLTVAPLVIAPPPGNYPAPLLNICTAIYVWLLTCINPTPLQGTHGPFIGATTGMVIR